MVRREELKEQVLHLLRLQGKVLWEGAEELDVLEEWTSISLRGWPLWNADGGREDVFYGSIMLELAEMVEDDPLNAEASGVESEDKGGPCHGSGRKGGEG